MSKPNFIGETPQTLPHSEWNQLRGSPSFQMNNKETNLLPSFDLRLVILSCLRISAVLNDIELS